MKRRIKPDFNRFLAAVTRERLPDRLPVSEIEVDVEIMEGFMGHRIRNVKDYVNFWDETGYDYTVVCVRGQPLPDHPYQQIIGQPDPNKVVENASKSTFAGGGIKDEATFDTYPWIGPEKVYYGDVDRIKHCLLDGMKLVVNQGPLFSGIWRAMGLENFSIACAENPRLIQAISGKMGELCVDIIENVLQREWVGAIWLGDDLAYTGGLMASPDFMRTYVFPYYKRIGMLCQKYHKPFIFHSDGGITEVYEDLIECGIQAIHPNEPTSVDIGALKKKYGDRLSFIGNIDVGLLSRGTVEEVINNVKFLIENVAPGGGFALGSGNSVASYCLLRNYKAMLDTVHKYGDIY